MTIKDLKERIEDLPDDMEIVLQKDAEGNGYSPLAGVDPNCIYIPDSTWSGEVYSDQWSAEEACVEEEEWDTLIEQDRTLVLYPVN